MTRVFTPLLAALLLVLLVSFLWSGFNAEVGRRVLLGFIVLLVAVLAFLLFSVSARDPQSPPGIFDVAQIVMVVSALLVDAAGLWAIALRIHDFGFTPNRTAALGLNVILLVNLTWSAVLYVRFARGRSRFIQLEQWQTNYLTVYASWAAFVAILFPPAFGYS